ncbi:hypothetical protein EMCRGX_G023959 [Ephydatia muelleri]
MEASSIAQVVVKEIICRFGIPDTIHTDQGRNFESGLIRDICQLLCVKKTRTTPYHPESDGLVERFNRTLIDMLSMAVSDNERDWDLQLSTLLLAYRTSRHETTGTTPFFLMFGRDPQLPEDVMYSLPVESYTSEHQYCRELKRQLQQAYARVREHSRVCHVNFTNHGKDLIGGEDYWLTVYKIADCTNPRKKKVVHFNRLKRASIGMEMTLWKTVWKRKWSGCPTEVTDQAPKGSIDEVPGPSEEIPAAPVAQVPGQPAPAVVRWSTRQARPPVRYGDPISLPDDVEIL